LLREIRRLHYQGSHWDWKNCVAFTHRQISKLYPPYNFRMCHFFFFRFYLEKSSIFFIWKRNLFEL
jgi:hypothetical protein